MYQTDERKRFFACFHHPLLAVALGLSVISSPFAAEPVIEEAEKPEASEPKKETGKSYFEQNPSDTVMESIVELQQFKYEVGDYLDDFGDSVDRFLGDETLQIQRKGSQLKLYFPVTLYDNGAVQVRPNFRAYIDLPRFRKKMKLLISSFDESDSEDDLTSLQAQQLAANSRQTDIPQKTSIAAQYLIDSTANTLLQFDVGLKFDDIKLNPYIRARHRLRTQFQNGLISRTNQSFIYERIRHFVWDVKQVLDFRTEHNLMRSESYATWLYDDNEYYLTQRGIVYYQINPHRIRSYFVEGKGSIVDSVYGTDQVAVGMNWREKLYQNWLYAEVEPRFTWYADNDFHSAQFSTMFMIEMLFSKD